MTENNGDIPAENPQAPQGAAVAVAAVCARAGSRGIRRPGRSHLPARAAAADRPAVDRAAADGTHAAARPVRRRR